MRLTLRTLLAYLDDLLDHHDAHELQKKIQESPVASQLVHRIRNTVGQIRLDAPAVDGHGMGGDANTVSEYLDNTMPPEKVPDFERACLDSDVHLGEVAGCHQILTLVLGQPAHVDTSLRQRIYAVGRPDAHVASRGDHGVAELTSTSPAVTSLQRIDKPMELAAADPWEETEKANYVKRKRWPQLMPLAITALIAFVMVFAGLRGLGPFDQSHPLARFLGLNRPTQVAEADVDESRESLERRDEAQSGDSDVDRGFVETDQAAEQTQPTPFGTRGREVVEDGQLGANDRNGRVTGEFDQPPPANGVAEEDKSVEPHPSSESDSLSLDAPVGDSNNESLAATTSTLPEANVEPSQEASGADSAEPLMLGQEVNLDPSDISPDVPAADPPEPRAIVDPLAARGTAARDADVRLIPAFPAEAKRDDAIGELGKAVSTADESDPAILPAEARAAQTAGQLLNDSQVMVMKNDSNESWVRAEAKRPLLPGDELMALPLYRPQLALANGLQVTLVGMSRVRLNPAAPDLPVLNLKSARLLVAATQATGLSVELQFDERRGQLNLADAQTTTAVDLQRVHVPGSNPEEQPAHHLLRLFVTSGSASWIEEGKPAVELSPGQRLTILDSREPIIDEAVPPPAWINGSNAKPRDPIAAQQLAPRIAVDRPVELSLREQADSRFQEVRSLAACSLAHLGQLDPIIATLNDEQMKAYWSEQVETLRILVSLDPASAAQVREAMEKRHSSDAGRAFRMLWGYTPTELKAGDDESLIEMLSHESLDFRVIAIETLKAITGKDRTQYSAEKPEKGRRTGLNAWRELARKDGIGYKELPEILKLTAAE